LPTLADDRRLQLAKLLWLQSSQHNPRAATCQLHPKSTPDAPTCTRDHDHRIFNLHSSASFQNVSFDLDALPAASDILPQDMMGVNAETRQQAQDVVWEATGVAVF
jgi:hypothetical protein